MSGVRREGQASQVGRNKATFRPSAPIILVAAAVVLIAITTDLSRSGLHPSLPAAITLPTPEAAPPRPGTGTEPEQASTATPVAAEEPTTTAIPTYHPPPTTVSPGYPLGSPQPAGTGANTPVGNASVTPGSAPAGVTTTVPASGSPTGGSQDSYPEATRDSTETVPPNYPVVTSSPGSTTTSAPTSSTSDR